MVFPITATQTTLNYSSFPSSDSLIATRISDCLADISIWMSVHHLKLNLKKAELLFLPGKDCPHMDLLWVLHQLRGTSASYWRTNCAAQPTSVVTRSYRFALQHLLNLQLLVQALVISCLDYCNSLLAGLPAAAIKPLQRIQNTAARLVYNLPKFSHVTPLFRDLHWLPVAARIRFKTMVLAYKDVNGFAPTYLQALVRPHAPARALRITTSAGRLVLPSLRASKGRTAKSQLFCLSATMVDQLPADVRTTESITCFRKRFKTHLFRVHLDPA
ncbi:hypothetical protein N1851_000216 [Merluccius polli]|uniref:Reverse transcriptase n=1 Tax=Merluccius polli TaxID=89951 RepID=A0AA47PC11_MERPO|nr:hypothetical protein N1851_000216 [Merluccius polli]